MELKCQPGKPVIQHWVEKWLDGQIPISSRSGYADPSKLFRKLVTSLPEQAHSFSHPQNPLDTCCQDHQNYQSWGHLKKIFMVFLCFIFSSSWKTCFLLPENKKLTTYIRSMGCWFHVIWTVSHVSELNPVWESGRWDESLPPSLPTHSSSSQRWKTLMRTYLEGPLGQWSPTFLAPGTGLIEDSFSTDRRNREREESLGLIQVHYIYCAQFFIPIYYFILFYIIYFIIYFISLFFSYYYLFILLFIYSLFLLLLH